MKVLWKPSVCLLVLAFCFPAAAQDNNSAGQDNTPTLKTRPLSSSPDAAAATQSGTAAQPPSQTYGAPANAIPEGTRFIIMLKDKLDTSKIRQGKRFKAELREDLTTPSGPVIPRGRKIKGHVATFDRGYTGARLQLALDQIETRHGWVPLIGTVTGVPGDPSIKSTNNEGELTQRGPDKKRVLTNAAIGAAVGAVTGSLVAGGKGAAIGAAAGAGLGTGTGMLIKQRDLKLDKDTQLEVRLDRDLTVPVR